MDGSEIKTSKPWNKNVVLELLVLALVLWVAHYFYFRSLGLYEDDYSHISPPLGWHLSDLLSSLEVFVTWPLGRPLGFFLGNFLAFLGGKLGGLSAIYIIGYGIQATNVFLFYFLLRRIGEGAMAFIGALTFGLFPADTTHIFLMHATGLHTSLTFLLLASHAYLSGHKPLAHLLSLGSLLTYESPYIVFVAVPLVCQPWDKKLIKEMIRHIAVWLGILAAVVVTRAVLGEGRIGAVGSSSVSIVGIFGQILMALAIGPAVSLGTFLYGPAWTLSHWNRELTFVFVGCLPVLAWMLSRVETGAHEEPPAGSSFFRFHLFGPRRTLGFAAPHARQIKLLLTALIMLSLAYGFSFTHFPPTVTSGRFTSVHLAAAFGGALLFACICSLVLDFARSRRFGNVAIALLALYLSLMVSYRFSIQQDFKKAWQNERAFWSSVLPQIPDMADGTMIFVVNRGLPATRFIATNSWAEPIMLEQIYRFPSDWKTHPRLFIVPPSWTRSLVRDGDHFSWEIPAATWQPHWEVLPDANVILMEMAQGKLVRRYGVGWIMVRGQTLPLKPLTPYADPPWTKGTLYPLLIPGAQ